MSSENSIPNEIPATDTDANSLSSNVEQSELGPLPVDWKIQSLSSITDPNRPISYGIVQTGPNIANGIRCLRVVDIIDGKIDKRELITTTKKISDSYRRTILKEGDLVIPLRGKVGEVGLVDAELSGANLTRGVALIALREECNPKYVKQFLSSQRSSERFLASMNGSALQEITIATLRKFNVALPQPFEQTAIATALSDADALIDGLDQLITKKRNLKQATMQQLLTGKTRLPEFALRKDGTPKGYKQSELGALPEDWDLTAVGAHTGWLSGGTPNRSNEGFWSGSIPWISGSTLKTFEISTSDQFLTEEAVSAGSKMAPVGAILLLVRGSALHKEIRAGIVVAPVSFNQDVKALIPSKKLDSRFLTFFFLAREYNLLKLVSSAGNSAGVLDTELIKNFKLLLPAVDEQIAIAKALSDMDEDIQALQQRHCKLLQLKQGMMQELLTGKIRLIKPELTHGQ